MKASPVRAPSHDGGLLERPPLREVPALLAANQQKLDSWSYDFQGRDAQALRELARRDVLRLAASYHERFGLATDKFLTDPARIVMAGHQPELFHPGVWVKNFALAAVARNSEAQALNIIVDDDIPKSAGIRVPHSEGNELSTIFVNFDLKAGESPYEDWSCGAEDLFRSFGDRVRSTLGALIADPVIDTFWPKAVALADRTPNIGTRFAVARHLIEEEWGVQNAEVPWSLVCETDAFAWFVSHLLAHLPRFQQVHNESLVRYREAYGIRSQNHPVSALKSQGEWREAPFWIWRTGEPRRRVLLARQTDAKTIELRIAGEDAPFLGLPLGPDREACCAVERLLELPSQNIRLRTRALTTTLFSRLLIGDSFIHGIGGAKYDELGDEIIGSFFHTRPPGFVTLSQTLWLGLPERPGTPKRLREIQRRIRDLTYNADRFLSADDPARGALVLEKRRAIAAPVATRRQRIARDEEIKRINDALSPIFAPEREALEIEAHEIEADLAHNALARGRSFPFVLHSAARLQATFRDLAAESTGRSESL
jgi:hypothetical protein